MSVGLRLRQKQLHTIIGRLSRFIDVVEEMQLMGAVSKLRSARQWLDEVENDLEEYHVVQVDTQNRRRQRREQKGRA